jgi:hypothetical protein
MIMMLRVIMMTSSLRWLLAGTRVARGSDLTPKQASP